MRSHEGVPKFDTPNKENNAIENELIKILTSQLTSFKVFHAHFLSQTHCDCVYGKNIYLERYAFRI